MCLARPFVLSCFCKIAIGMKTTNLFGIAIESFNQASEAVLFFGFPSTAYTTLNLVASSIKINVAERSVA